MDMTAIDTVRADTLEVGDTIEVSDYGLVTITKVEEDGLLISIYTDADPDDPFVFSWDQVLDIYGYTD